MNRFMKSVRTTYKDRETKEIEAGIIALISVVT